MVNRIKIYKEAGVDTDAFKALSIRGLSYIEERVAYK